jgi:pyruvate/2-oxoglutarate dehydrogenase complex dihydrolipoamide dehydrogenase (E3) component
MAAERFDAVVIGSGQGGNPLAAALAEHGWKVALVERGPVGGTCVNVGCTPTKTMVASARVAYLARRAAEFGVNAGAVSVNLAAVRARKDQVVARSRGSSYKKLTGTPGLLLIEGVASFTDPHELSVALNAGGTRQLTSQRIVIDTGARPERPRIEGLAQVAALDSTSIMELNEVPEHLIVLGGGTVALEFGQMFRRFGSRVTLIERGPRLAEHEDEDVSEAIRQIFEQDGIEVLLGASAKRVLRAGAGVRLELEVGESERAVEGSHLLVATGRVPHTESLALDRAAIALDARGFIQVNDRLETNVPGVFALGDVKGGPAFTHIAYDDYRVLKANLLGGPPRVTSGRPVPYTIFMDPELGRIGITEAQARNAGRPIKVAKMPMASVARAFESDETRGFLKAIVDAETDRILGASCLGEHGGEYASMLEIAMLGGVTASALRDGIWSHPTWSEAFNHLFSMD